MLYFTIFMIIATIIVLTVRRYSSVLLTILLLAALAFTLITYIPSEPDLQDENYVATYIYNSEMKETKLEFLPHKDKKCIVQAPITYGPPVFEFCIKDEKTHAKKLMLTGGDFTVKYIQESDKPYVRYKNKYKSWILTNKPSAWLNYNKWFKYKDYNVGDELAKETRVIYCEFYVPKSMY